jgi:3-isopropylmalate dehydrogenase
MGLMPSASVGEHTSLAIHGSYPQTTGLNIANPLATISSNDVEDAFGLHEEAATIRAAVNKSLEKGIVTEGPSCQDSSL